jgi:glycine betaine/proline transport system substrate-binding protein
MENEMMGAILDGGKAPKAAAGEWLKAHPGVVRPWLEGVTTFNGGDAEAAVRSLTGS